MDQVMIAQPCSRDACVGSSFDLRSKATQASRLRRSAQRRSAQRRSAQRGYVLLVALGLLVLSSSLMVAIGRAAAHHTLEARSAQNELQRRWGEVSCRNAVLANAEQILVSNEQQEGRAIPEIRSTIQLGDDRFTLVVADEQAKANVNLMIQQMGVEAAGDRIRQALAGSGLVNDVRLRPALGLVDPTVPAQLIRAPGQIFNSIDPDKLIVPRASGNAPMQTLTCWGNGSLNVMRAGHDAMRCSLGGSMSELEISRLITARDVVAKMSIASHPVASDKPAPNMDAIGSLLAQAQVDPKQRNRLSLTARSSCHSLWIIVEDSRRQWHSFTVVDQTNANHPVTRSIVW